MDHDLLSRREFLLRSSAVAAAPLLTGIHADTFRAIAHDAARSPRPPGFLRPSQYRVLEAATNRIFPAVDGAPNAAAMHAPQFIDIALARVLVGARKAYVAGIQSLD